ncbi:hypothetical protein [Natrinema sp. 1APR25-10V2]|uniref:hypothetical protein n=1 Tax=Natrinema sp. 1APR25-10V2 TaxID=2951081 RepID=UPI00287566A9|nr:hypothetical protein [Natrinema sp. 1APR25-10V2]MDS0474064.1 hypothetical protein [Natrinema sp. 1APR25-10V2]
MNNTNDQLYEVLANEQRRQLLFGLLDENPRADSPIDLDTPPDDVIAERTDRIEQRHVHLPKLDDYGFIEWIPSMSCVEKGPRFDEIRPTLELLAKHHGKFSA